MRHAYYVRNLRPHVWGIMRRHTDNLDAGVKPDSARDALVLSIGARGIGDAAARTQVRAECDRLNGTAA